MFFIQRLRSIGYRSSVALLLLVCATAARAESDLEKALRQLNSDAVKGYIQPIADFFGANTNAGFSHSVRIPEDGFHFRFDIIAVGSVVGDEQKTYTLKAPAGYSPSEFKTATVFGGKGDSIAGPPGSGLMYKGSDGVFNTTLFPFVTPQITIGHIYGTEAMIRFVPIPELSDGKIPKITLFGAGIRHSLSQYIEDSPLDMAIGFQFNSFTFGDLMSVKGYGIGVQAGKTLAILELYGGVQYEKSTMNLSYKSTDPTITTPLVDIDLEGANTFRGTLGASLHLSVLKLYADANFGTVTNFTAGIGFGF